MRSFRLTLGYAKKIKRIYKTHTKRQRNIENLYSKQQHMFVGWVRSFVRVRSNVCLLLAYGRRHRQHQRYKQTNRQTDRHSHRHIQQWNKTEISLLLNVLLFIVFLLALAVFVFGGILTKVLQLNRQSVSHLATSIIFWPVTRWARALPHINLYSSSIL